MKSKPIPKTDYIYSPSSEQNYKYIKVLALTFIVFRVLNGNLELHHVMQ